MDPVRVTIWNEHVQERTDAPVAAIYPEGMHAAIAAGMSSSPNFRSGTDGAVRTETAPLGAGNVRSDTVTLPLRKP